MFLFLTRTKHSDYRLRENSGQDSKGEGFTSVLGEAGIPGTEKPFAVLVKGRVVAGGMMTGRKDVHGRQIRFSFSLDSAKAPECFMHLVRHWDDAEKLMKSCLEEKDDAVAFDDERFTAWLEDYDAQEVKPRVKWEKSSGNILPFPAKKRKSRKKAIVIAGVAALAVLAVAAMRPGEKSSGSLSTRFLIVESDFMVLRDSLPAEKAASVAELLALASEDMAGNPERARELLKEAADIMDDGSLQR